MDDESLMYSRLEEMASRHNYHYRK